MGLLQNMLDEPVTRLTLRPPVVCKPSDTVEDAIERMREKQLGCVIVVDKEDKPLGMLTESMITQLLLQDPPPLDAPLQEHMADQWPWLYLTDPIADVLEAMQARNVRFICVVDKHGRVAAVTGQKGLMEYVAEHFPRQVMVQRVGCEPLLNREGA